MAQMMILTMTLHLQSCHLKPKQIWKTIMKTTRSPFLLDLPLLRLRRSDLVLPSCHRCASRKLIYVDSGKACHLH
jgi:hypothetical protein